jgi:hypothetical protein
MKYVRKFLVISLVPSSLSAHVPSANHSVSTFLGNQMYLCRRQWDGRLIGQFVISLVKQLISESVRRLMLASSELAGQLLNNLHSGGVGGVQIGSTRHVGHWLAYCTCSGRLWGCRILWNKDWQAKPKYSVKTCPSATLSTTNATWPDRGSNPGRLGEKPVTNRLRYDAAQSVR